MAVRFAHSSNKGRKGGLRRSPGLTKGEPNAQAEDEVGREKRFKITGTGKVVYAQAGKRHGMIKRTKKQIRNLRGTTTMFEGDAYNVKKFFLPNG